MKLVLAILTTLLLTGCVESNGSTYSRQQQNLYTQCVRRLAEAGEGSLTYEEMKDACSVYLK